MNWQDKCEVIYHFRNDASILIVTKPEYRFDGCHAVVLDSKTAELALSNNANWKTISGAKVLVGKGGKVIAGMGGKFSHVPQKGGSIPSLNGFKGVAESKDLDGNFSCVSGTSKSWVQQIAEQQGIDGKPRLVDDAEFRKAATECGILAYRTWEDFNGKAANEFKDELSHNDSILYNNEGKQVWGGGIYVAATNNPKAGTLPTRGKRIQKAVQDSCSYGAEGKRATAVITFDKSMKIADGNKLNKEFWKRDDYLSKYNGDIGAYLASKGYDAARFMRSKDVDYIVVYNRTKMIVLNDPDHMAYGLANEYHSFY